MGIFEKIEAMNSVSESVTNLVTTGVTNCEKGEKQEKNCPVGDTHHKNSKKKFVTEINDSIFQPKGRREIDPELKKIFLVGFKWIMGNLPELLEAGWTRPSLFRRSIHKWPVGNWGAAWLFIPESDQASTKIGKNGEIIFTYDSNSRKVIKKIYSSSSFL